jgi:hypothetical protein
LISSLDKELVKLAEKNAHERVQRERAAKENKDIAAAAKLANQQIEVKPIIETVPSEPNHKQSRKSYVHISNGDHNNHTTEDLLRFTPPLEQQPTSAYPRPTTPQAIPAKLQQMSGPSGPVRKSTKAKW